MSDTPAPGPAVPQDPVPDTRAPGPPRFPRAWRADAPVVAAVALGGALGASARYAAVLLRPAAADAFPWTVFWVNVAGCAVIGAFTVLVTEGARTPHPLLRPFFGTGVLGGFTTFSAYALDIHRLHESGEPLLALLYLAGTLAAALAAVLLGAASARLALRGRRSR
ncbi:FluC/FEX family fluoride channel [Streptomyces abyssomicinicus]|uniref:FluC/FEX family fluoride channel n=1 Tax=Streptomyces abyssomicinicus TaxID=574929 RepID=UPI00124F8E5E|nr:CrcB family protein [Streptomyces abyssomicinicus]